MSNHRRFAAFNREQSLLSTLTRRRFLQFAATASAAAATTRLTACGSSNDEGEVTGAAAGNNTLRVLSWPGYDEPEVIDGFKEEFGVDVEFRTYLGGEQMLQFYNQSPQGTFDVLIADGEYVERLVALDALEALNPDDFPNLADYHPEYQEFDGFFHEGEMMAVGARFGNYGIAFNQDLIDPAAVTSWDFLLDDSLRNQVALFDWYLPNMGNASLALFPDTTNPYDLSDSQLEEVRQWMLRLKPNTALISSNIQDIVTGFLSGDITAGPVGDWVIQNAIADNNPQFTAVVPSEGAIRWSEAAAVCTGAPNPDLALAWVQYMTRPEVQARLANAQAYKGIAPNLEAVDFLEQDEKELLGYVPAPSDPEKLLIEVQLERTFARQLPVQQQEQAWQNIYNEFKTA